MTLDIQTTPLSETLALLAASPAFPRDGVCFAADTTALYRSQDGGQSWHSCYAALGLEGELATTALVLSPNFARDGLVFAGINGGILRSNDGGQSWQAARLAEPAPLVSALAVSPNVARDRLVFAGTLEDGFLRSEDGGRTWAAWNFGLLDLSVLALAVSPNFSHDATLYAGTGSGIFRSTNAGHSWREVALPVEFTTVLSLAYTPEGSLLAGSETDGLFVSEDGNDLADAWHTRRRTQRRGARRTCQRHAGAGR